MKNYNNMNKEQLEEEYYRKKFKNYETRKTIFKIGCIASIVILLLGILGSCGLFFVITNIQANMLS